MGLEKLIGGWKKAALPVVLVAASLVYGGDALAGETLSKTKPVPVTSGMTNAKFAWESVKANDPAVAKELMDYLDFDRDGRIDSGEAKLIEGELWAGHYNSIVMVKDSATGEIQSLEIAHGKPFEAEKKNSPNKVVPVVAVAPVSASKEETKTFGPDPLGDALKQIAMGNATKEANIIEVKGGEQYVPIQNATVPLAQNATVPYGQNAMLPKYLEGVVAVVQLPGQSQVSLVYGDMTVRDVESFNRRNGWFSLSPEAYQSDLESLVTGTLHGAYVGGLETHRFSNNLLGKSLGIAFSQDFSILDELGKAEPINLDKIIVKESSIEKYDGKYTGTFTAKEFVDAMEVQVVEEYLAQRVLEANGKKLDLSGIVEENGFVKFTKENWLSIIFPMATITGNYAGWRVDKVTESFEEEWNLKFRQGVINKIKDGTFTDVGQVYDAVRVGVETIMSKYNVAGGLEK